MVRLLPFIDVLLPERPCRSSWRWASQSLPPRINPKRDQNADKNCSTFGDNSFLRVLLGILQGIMSPNINVRIVILYRFHGHLILAR